jgi:hypothetical protein
LFLSIVVVVIVFAGSFLKGCLLLCTQCFGFLFARLVQKLCPVFGAALLYFLRSMHLCADGIYCGVLPFFRFCRLR